MNKQFRMLLENILGWAKRHFILVLIITAVISMAISLSIGLRQSVWFDEAYSIMLARQPLSQLMHLTSVDTHPPAYYLLLSGWGNLFGWGEFALRSLSVLTMGGAIIFAGLLTRKMFGIRTALYSLPFVMLAPFLLRYGFEIRMYSLASLIGIAATYVLICAIEAKDKRRLWLYVLYALLVALGVYTLYYTVLLWAAHLTWLLWRNFSKKESVLKSDWAKAYLLSIVLFLPWMPTFVHQITNGALAPISQSMTLDNFFGIISFSFLYRPVWQLDALLSLIILFVITMLGNVSVRAFKIADKKQKPYLFLLALYILVPVIALTLVGLVHPMYVERYLAHVLIGASLFIGVSLVLVMDKTKLFHKIYGLALIFVMVLGIVQLADVGNYNFQRLQHPAINQVADRITTCDSNTAVYAADPYVAIELSYYLPKCQINFFSDTASLGGGYAGLSNSALRIAKPAAELATKRAIYYVYYGDAKLTMPASFVSTKKETDGSLVVEYFRQN